MSNGTRYSLYGSASGDWCIVVSPVGFISPASIGHLRYLADPNDAFTGLIGQLKESAGPRFPVQQALADHLGITQTEVSRYALGKSQPRLSDANLWRRVAALTFAWTEWPDKPVDEAAVRAFLAGRTEPAALEATG